MAEDAKESWEISPFSTIVLCVPEDFDTSKDYVFKVFDKLANLKERLNLMYGPLGYNKWKAPCCLAVGNMCCLVKKNWQEDKEENSAYLQTALDELLDYVVETGVQTLEFIHYGNFFYGKVDWNCVKDMIRETFMDYDVSILYLNIRNGDEEE